MYVNEFDETPFEAVKYLSGECNYGGRVTDNWDRRAINTILDIFCCPQVVENPDYSFCDISSAYGIPYLNDYHAFIQKIEVLQISHLNNYSICHYFFQWWFWLSFKRRECTFITSIPLPEVYISNYNMLCNIKTISKSKMLLHFETKKQQIVDSKLIGNV